MAGPPIGGPAVAGGPPVGVLGAPVGWPAPGPARPWGAPARVGVKLVPGSGVKGTPRPPMPSGGVMPRPDPGRGSRVEIPPGGGAAESQARVTVTVLPAGTGPFGATETTVPVGSPVSSAQAICGVSPCSRSHSPTVAYFWSWKAGTVR